MQSYLVFNIASVISFSSVIMTFISVNYFFAKVLHNYASDDPPELHLWVWVKLNTWLCLMIAAVIKEKHFKKRVQGLV